MTVLLDRFEIEREAGRGGMGTVFRAYDRRTERIVALNIVEPELANARFEREAELLATLDDPGIVRYVAHGRLDAGRMFIAMEWLEGVPLDARLEAGPLGVEATIAAARRIARALATAHARGVVHRDVKPANVILRGDRPEEATLVDFGIARVAGKMNAMTATGTVIGTPAYMAPEQARGQSVDARADVFSLGCVLFECLTGRPAFSGEHVIAVLAKVLLEPAPRVRVLPPLDDLIARMLEKDVTARPANGASVIEALDHLGSAGVDAAADPIVAAVGTDEARFATVILARAVTADVAAGDTAASLAGLTSEELLSEAAEKFGVPLTGLANGTLVDVVVAAGGASDAGERAARCALAMRRRMRDATIALSTGRAVVGTSVPVGTAIDAAARLLTRNPSSPGVFIDAGTAAIIEHRFDLSHDGGAISILSERGGGPSSAVGRTNYAVRRARARAGDARVDVPRVRRRADRARASGDRATRRRQVANAPRILGARDRGDMARSGGSGDERRAVRARRRRAPSRPRHRRGRAGRDSASKAPRARERRHGRALPR